MADAFVVPLLLAKLGMLPGRVVTAEGLFGKTESKSGVAVGAVEGNEAAAAAIDSMLVCNRMSYRSSQECWLDV